MPRRGQDLHFLCLVAAAPGLSVTARSAESHLIRDAQGGMKSLSWLASQARARRSEQRFRADRQHRGHGRFSLFRGWPGLSSCTRIRTSGLLGLPLRASNPHFISRVAWSDPRLRASNEHLLIVRVPRARGRSGYPLSPLFEQLPNPRLNLVQPLAQVGLKYIGLGLHHHALGLELVLEQHQLGE